MREILQSFLILFEADTTNLRKGTKEAEKQVDDLNKTLERTDKIGLHVGSTFKNLIRQAGGFLTAALSAGALIQGVKSAAHFADALGELSESLNVNVESLSVCSDAVASSGGTVEGFQNTVRMMTASLTEFANTGEKPACSFL